MGVPTFNNFELNDETYITETIEHRTRAPRRLETDVISRRIGSALLNTQIQQKTIQIAGTIITSSPMELQTAVDNLHKHVSRIEGDLVIESGRTYEATAERIRIPDRSYNQTIVEFELQFVCVRPYSEGSSQIATVVIPSGTNTYNFVTTISGSAPNRPTFRFTLPSGSGSSLVVRVDVQYSETGNQLTISGGLLAASALVANYDRYLVTQNGVNKDFVGQMDDIEAGDATFYITVSGKNDGTRVSIEYSPRYW